MKRGWILTSAVYGAMLAGVSVQAQSTQPSAPRAAPGLGFTESVSGAEALGPQFTSQAAGISLRPPAGSKQITRGVAGDTVVEYLQEDKKMSLRVTRTVLQKPMKLSIPSTDGAAANRDRGMFELSIETLQSKLPNNKILRQDVIPLAGHDAGIVILRANVGVQDQFVQQAVLQASEQLYYTISMTSPGQTAKPPRDPKEPDVEPKPLPPTPAEVEAAEMFKAMLNSVAVLDQEKLRIEQDNRLYATRSLFLNWNEAKLRSVLVSEQWTRVIKDGKDIGYSYMVEEPETRGTNPGVKIGIRSRVYLPEKQIDGEVWYHASYDRRNEGWSSLSLFTEPKGKSVISEFGTSSQRRKAVRDPNGLGEGGDPMNRGTKLIDTYTISVHRKSGNQTAPPIDRDLPPYYLPQAMVHLLPRLLPLDRPSQYMFATWIANSAEVTLRYVDVGAPKEVAFNGQKLNVIPIVERVGYDGPPTTHYLTVSGKYLGSETVAVDNDGVRTVVTALPSDAATLTGLWRDANLSAPTEKTPDVGTEKSGDPTIGKAGDRPTNKPGDRK